MARETGRKQIPIIDIQFKIYIQQEGDNDDIMHSIKMTKSNIVYETFHNILQYLETRSIHYSFHELPRTCLICFENIENEPNHVQVAHPRCWCEPTRFIDVEAMINHTDTHETEIRCPLCRIMLNTFKDIIKHCLEEQREIPE